jgi:phosphate starvation-inducible protein PhoH
MTAQTQKKITRKERRSQRRTNNREEIVKEKFNFSLKKINPLTENQKNTFDSYEDGQHILLVGTAGTGKSFLSIYLGMRDIMENKTQEKMIIVRSVVPTRDIGFLPGSNKEKSKVYEAPYYSIFSEIFGRGDAYEYLKSKNIVEFMTTSFVRGITINNCIIIVDEFQNMNFQEISSIMTRIGKNCRIILSGDIRQTDLTSKYDSSGFRNFFKIINRMKSFDVIEFTSNDIVRSDIVREFIMTRELLEDMGEIFSL